MSMATEARAPRLNSFASLASVAILSAFVALAPNASADTMEIFFSGINIDYDGTNIVDADPDLNDPDPVSVSFSVNGGNVATFMTGVTADLLISNVILVANTNSIAGPGSYFELAFPDGADGDSDPDFVRLELNNVMVTYLDGAPKDFVFSASAANGYSFSDSLPIEDLALLEMPITLSFSAQTSTSSVGLGGVVSSFTASGTGEIRADFDPDTGNMIPEPASVGMAVLAGLMGGAFVMRKRLG